MIFKKNLVYSLIAGCMAVLGAASCSEESGTVPVSLDQSTLTYKAGAGKVTLYWNIPEDADYYYVKVTYNHPENGACMRAASIYSDSIVIDNLLKAYGAIDYTLTTVSRDGTEGDVSCTVSAQADAAERSVVVTGSQALTLSADGLWTDAQEPSEGPIANLVDGSTSTFFHMNWSSPEEFPHYIVVDLDKEVDGVSFTYTCRDNANCNNPDEMEVYASSSFDGETFDETAFDAELLASLSDLPATQAATYTSSQYVAENPFRYLWFKVLSEVNGNSYVALAELTVNELETEIEDPEEEYEQRVD